MCACYPCQPCSANPLGTKACHTAEPSHTNKSPAEIDVKTLSDKIDQILIVINAMRSKIQENSKSSGIPVSKDRNTPATDTPNDMDTTESSQTELNASLASIEEFMQNLPDHQVTQNSLNMESLTN